MELSERAQQVYTEARKRCGFILTEPQAVEEALKQPIPEFVVQLCEIAADAADSQRKSADFWKESSGEWRDHYQRTRRERQDLFGLLRMALMELNSGRHAAQGDHPVAIHIKEKLRSLGEEE